MMTEILHLFDVSDGIAGVDRFYVDTMAEHARRVVGHSNSCPCSKDPISTGQPCGRYCPSCTCGHSFLKVYAWPAPAGEGVLDVTEEWGHPASDGEQVHRRVDWLFRCNKNAQSLLFQAHGHPYVWVDKELMP